MPRFAERTLGDVLAALASDAAAPGSGAAAAVAMAFAAACAGKALAISRKHRPPEAHMQLAEQRLAVIARCSLARADADSELFEEFIHHRGAKTASQLVHADESTQGLATELGGVLDEIAGAVHPVVEVDLAAARTLLSAVNAIQQRIRAENQREAPTG
jgi:Formiminotransferase-cyclodeaminase